MAEGQLPWKDTESGSGQQTPEVQSLALHPATPVIERPPQAGDLCPRCAEGRVDYDGLLNLTCPECGFTLAGCFT